MAGEGEGGDQSLPSRLLVSRLQGSSYRPEERTSALTASVPRFRNEAVLGEDTNGSHSSSCIFLKAAQMIL
jgi:hypothetical protein